MLEFFRKHSQSLLMWLLVGTIGFIFIVQFGPQSRGCRSQQDGVTYVAKVRGKVISDEAFRWAWIISHASSVPRDQSKALRLKEAVVNGLIERELLAMAAEDLGIKVTEADIDDNILNGLIYYNASVHSPVRMPSGPIPIDFTKEDGSFDYETFKMFVASQFQMSLPGFKNQQMREVLADRMRKIIENSVQLFPGEARESYEKVATWVKVESATFDPAEFARKITPSQADVKRWAQANEAMIEDHYKKNEFRYKNVEKQVRMRNILIKVPADAADEVMQEKKALADDIAARAAKGEDFAALAKAYSEDEQSRAAGGDNGFKGKGVFEEGVEDAAFGMKAGEVKGPLETLDGFQIVKVEGFREGTIPLDEVRLEIAEQILVETRSSEQARSEAEKFLALVQAGDDFGTAARKIRGEKVAAPEAAPPPAAAGEEEEGAVEVEEEEEAAEAETPGVWQPVVRTSSEIGKDAAHIPGVGPSKQLVTELFALAGPQTLLPRVVEVNGKFHILRVKERHEGSDAEYLAKKDALERELLGEKRLALVEQWIDTQRKKAEKEGAIEIQQVYLKYPGEDTQSESGD